MQLRSSAALVGAAAAVLATTALVTPVHAAPQKPQTPRAAQVSDVALTPATLRTAYDLDGLYAKGITGKGVTIGIVDSFGSPTLQHDLDVFSDRFHLPHTTVQVVHVPTDPPAFDPSNDDMVGWAGETTLDVEIAHAVAPGATIVVYATPTSETEGRQGFPEIIAAENAALTGSYQGRAVPKADLLSQSFAATEETFTGPDEVKGLSQQVYPAAKAAGVTVLSSSGDSGPVDYMLDEKTRYDRAVTDWPTSDPLVTSVGGTEVNLSADGSRLGPDTPWSGGGSDGAAGGGRSSVFSRPSFQDGVAGVVGSHRGVPDLSLDASPASGLLIYGSYTGHGSYTAGGGTSQAAPLLAGIVALADQAAGARVGYLNDVLYGTIAKDPDGGIVDVTSGSNDCPCSKVPGYQATSGYDLASGLGTVDGGKLVPALVAATKGRTQPLAQSGTAAPSTTTAPPTTAASASPSDVGTTPRADATTPAKKDGSGRTVAAIVAAVLLVLVAAGGAWAWRRRHRPSA